MNDERNALADIFTGHTVSFGAFPKRLMRGHAQEIASRILAVGYRKPQQITTELELDDVPVGTVIRTAGTDDEDPRVAVKTAKWPDESEWIAADLSEYPLSSDELDDFPATVLHLGGGE